MSKNSKINKTYVIVAIIIGLAIVFSTYLNISYKNKVFEAEQEEKRQERLKEEQAEQEEEKEEELNKLMLETCLSDAYDIYSEEWASACEKRGEKEDCTLYGNIPKVMEERWIRNREECFKKYPVE